MLESKTKSVSEPLHQPMAKTLKVLPPLVTQVDQFNSHQSPINPVLKSLVNTKLPLAVFNNSKSIATIIYHTLATLHRLMAHQTRYNGGPTPKYEH